jgi:hypothetical protein
VTLILERKDKLLSLLLYSSSSRVEADTRKQLEKFSVGKRKALP